MPVEKTSFKDTPSFIENEEAREIGG